MAPSCVCEVDTWGGSVWVWVWVKVCGLTAMTRGPPSCMCEVDTWGGSVWVRV